MITPEMELASLEDPVPPKVMIASVPFGFEDLPSHNKNAFSNCSSDGSQFLMPLNPLQLIMHSVPSENRPCLPILCPSFSEAITQMMKIRYSGVPHAPSSAEDDDESMDVESVDDDDDWEDDPSSAESEESDADEFLAEDLPLSGSAPEDSERDHSEEEQDPRF